ncbi:MAG: hypothetical protein U0414_02895 [Polyangiaceae bacterium]
MQHIFKSFFVAAALGGACALMGCGAGDTGEVRLGVSVAPLTELGDPTVDPRAAAGLEITRVRVLVNVAKVGYAGPSDGDASVGPYVVELTGDEITAGASRSFSLGELAAGTYGGAEIEVDVLSADADTSSDPSLADFASTKASVLIDGNYNGAAFQFAGHFLAEQGTDGEVTIDTTAGFDLPMTVDPSTWFLDANGAVLDPTDAAQHQAIAAAICKSLDTQPLLTESGGGPGGHGHGGGGGPAHCVEAAQ